MGLSSNVRVTEAEPGLRPIAAADSTVPAFVGVAERGPIGVPKLITSFSGYKKIFGGFIAALRDLPLAVMAFFDNGGQSLYVSRTVHFTDVTDDTTGTAVSSSGTATKGGNPGPATVLGAAYPIDLAPGDGITISVSGGGDLVATFDAGSAAITGTGGAYDLDGNDTLTVLLDNVAVQSYTFVDGDSSGLTLSNITDAELALAINREFAGISADLNAGDVRITTDKEGTSALLTIAGSARAIIGFGAVPAMGSGDVADINAVTQAEAKIVIEADVAGVVVDAGANLSISTVATGLAATLEPKGATAAAFALALVLVPGTADALVNVISIAERYPAGLIFSAVLSAATSGDADRFNLTISQDGTVIENWPSVSADPAADDFVVDVLTEATSIFIVTHLGAAGDPRPDNQTVAINGGDDGLTALADVDFTGGEGTGTTGLRTLDSILDLSLVGLPGRASVAIAAGLTAYCEVIREGTVFAIMEFAEGLSPSAAVTYKQANVTSEHTGIWWPHVKVSNPSSAVFGSDTTLTIPNTGPIMGMIARVDGRRDGGVYDSPAGWERAALAVVGLANTEVNKKAVRDVLYPQRINPIRTGPNRPIYSDGGRTANGSGSFPNISERRGVILISRSIKDGLDYTRHQNHDATLRASARRTVVAFLRNQMALGAFRSDDEDEAFYVICDLTNNPLEIVLAGKLILDVGLATAKPNEFTEVSISQDTRGFAS